MMDTTRIKKFLSLPVVSVLVIIIAIAARVFIQFYYLNIDNDKSYQILAARHFLHGHGFSLLEASLADLSASHFVPLIKWPPGYSLLLAPFLAIVKNDVILATLLLDSMACILFIVFARKILFFNSLPVWLVNMYTLFAGFFFYSFCTASSSDFITLTVFIMALYYTLRVFQSARLQPLMLAGISVLLFLTAFTRYMYIPVALTAPTCFIFNSFFIKDRLLLKKAGLLFGFTALLIFAFLFLQHSTAGSAFYIRDAEKGFYTSNLAKFHPVLFSSFLNLDFATTSFSQITGFSFGSVSRVILIIHSLAVAALVAVVVYWLIQKKMKCSSRTDLYLFCGISISLVIAFSLIALSLRNSLYLEYGYGGWTYVQEGRYFAFITFFVQQAAFILLYRFRHTLKKMIRVVLLTTVLIAGLDMFHNMYYILKTVTQKNVTFSNIKSIHLLNYTDQITKKLINDNPGKKIMVVSQPAHYAAQAGFYQPIPALYIFSSLRSIEINTGEPVTALFITNSPDSMPVSFSQDPSLKITGTFNKYTFYSVNVEPRQP